MPELRTPTHPEMEAAIQECIDVDRGWIAGKLDGDEVLHLYTWRSYPAELMVYRRGLLYRFPIEERLPTMTAYRLWRATRVAFATCTTVQSG